MDYWAKPGIDRNQAVLFSPTLDDTIPDDHPVRLLDEILRGLKWSEWTKEYNLRHGQPPIPPWIMAGVVLYGLMRRIRSSRQLEYACVHNLDFMWLVEGRTIDHDTICKFRTKFQEPLAELFEQIGHIGMEMQLVRLLEVAFDGTRVKANASRLHTWTAEKVEALLKELGTRAEAMLKEAGAVDAEETALWGESEGAELPPELADVKQRQMLLLETLERLRNADAARKKDGIDAKKNPAQLPKADTDSKVMPNKEGGYAPNYTPTVASDGVCGFIVDCDVISGPNEQNELLPAVDRIEETFGKKIAAMSADGAFGTGPNLQGMEERGVGFYTPVASPEPQEGNPAKRDDPRQSVPEADWAKLPRNDQKKLDKSCFVYDEAADCYYCPMGKEMPYDETKKYDRSTGTVELRIHRCSQCEGCPLAGECLAPTAKRGRTISRDGYEPLRDAMHAKLKTEEGKKIYSRRMHIAETPFAIIKAVMEVRRFLLRGVKKVRTEWLWVCTAYNLRKLIAAMATLRAASEKMSASVEG
jgi:transposase